MKKFASKKNILGIIILVFIFTILYTDDLQAKRKNKGREILIYKLDGSFTKGELLKANKESVLIMDMSLHIGVTIRMEEIRSILISIKKKSSFSKYFGKGFVYGAVAGAAYGLISHAPGTNNLFNFTKGNKIFISTLGFGIAGSIGGGLIGLFSKPKETSFKLYRPFSRAKILKLQKYSLYAN